MFGFADLFRRQSTSERLAGYRLRPDLLDAADAMVSDARSDRYIAALESALTASETVLRIMDGRHRDRWGLLGLTSERVLFQARKGSGGLSLNLPLTAVLSIEGSTSRASGTVRVTSADGVETIDKILGTQGEMLAGEARAIARRLLG